MNHTWARQFQRKQVEGRRFSLFLILSLFLAAFEIFGGAAPVHAQNVGINTTAPDASALLEMLSTTKGLLIPRMTYVQKNAIASPKLGLLVFQTDSINSTTPMTFYYWDGTKWIPFMGYGAGWLVLGNSGTNSTSNFLGTIDSVDHVIRTNNIARLRTYADGNLRLVNPSGKPSEQLQWSDSTGGHITSMRARYMTRDVPYTLPDSQGLSGEVLSNDGSGNLYWAYPGAGLQFSSTTLPTLTGAVADLLLDPNDRVIYRIQANSNNYTVSGFQGGWDGRFIIICNVSTGNQNVGIANQSTACPVASDRLITGGGQNVSIAPNQSLLFVYDGVSQRWRAVAKSP